MDEQQYALCSIINQIFAVEKAVEDVKGRGALKRKFERIYDSLKSLHLSVRNPLHEPYDFSRVDCEATISGEEAANLRIVEVLKPIIYHWNADQQSILQRGIVIVSAD